ncbi:flagellar protein FlgN [Fontimonas sp. SYSU GA230001]|uniref:flagella synthesis protein FlgN n=1 Tax=Fontimonas sp. SYSU GA230001 TaxID=3142450 RepID=UPI0032B4C1C3
MTASLSQRLDEHLHSHLDCARLLEKTLHEEHEALLANDVGALERITQTKSAASERLDALGNTLQRLRGEAGAPSIAALLVQADAGGAAALWQQLIDTARRCADANRDNAILLEGRSQQIRNALRMVRGEAATDTYGRSGDTHSGFGPRSLGSA